MKPKRARIIDRQWSAWTDPIEREERNYRLFPWLVLMWIVAVTCASYAAWEWFIPYILSFR